MVSRRLLVADRAEERRKKSDPNEGSEDWTIPTWQSDLEKGDQLHHTSSGDRRVTLIGIGSENRGHYGFWKEIEARPSSTWDMK